MNNPTIRTIACAGALAAIAAAGALAGEVLQGVPAGALNIQVLATDAHVVRRELGPPRVTLQGVPAEPVDSFAWNGNGVQAVAGEIVIDLDVSANTGTIVARWSDRFGEWSYTQQAFVHPEHASGVRIGAGVDESENLLNDPVVANVYLHGDTTAGQPVLPTVFAYVAAWGPAFVTLDGEPFVNPFGLPSPLWLGHVMVTEGVRRPDGTVRTIDGGIYSPAQASRGEHDPGDLEVHLVFHDERFPRTGNIPPLFSFFAHVMFESVSIQLSERAGPGRADH